MNSSNSQDRFAIILRLIKVALCLIPCIIAIFLILRAFLFGNLSDIRYGGILLLLFAATLFIPLKQQTDTNGNVLKRRLGRTIWIVPMVLVFPPTVVVMIFGSFDVAAYVFHLVFGTEGTPWTTLAPDILNVLIYWVVIAVTLIRFEFFTAAVPGWNIVVGALILSINPFFTEVLLNGGFAWLRKGESVIEEFRPVDISIAQKSQNHPHIIYFFVEGLERTYQEIDATKEAYTPISSMAEEAIEFTEVSQIYATGWSLAGTVATQCGVPLVIEGLSAITSKDVDDPILPQADCLSEITAKAGYQNLYMSGTEIVGENQGYFGFKNFFTTHGGSRVIDRSVHAEEAGEPDRVFTSEEGWGYRDSLVLNRALTEVDNMLSDGRPFFLTVATMDTHGPRAYMSPECISDDVPAISDDITFAVACSSSLAAEFVTSLRSKLEGEPYLLMVMSDHLSHLNNLGETLNTRARRNTVLMIDQTGPAEQISKPGSMIDVFPTVLDRLGWLPADSPRAGLGVSLFSDDLTLVEHLGQQTLDQRLKTDIELSKFLWSTGNDAE